MEISNKTHRPVRVPLPGGKKLHLAASGKAKINAKAADHPAVLKLIEEGTIEIVDGGKGGAAKGEAGSAGLSGSQKGSGAGGSLRHTGDR